ncbi:hypothetical protein ACFL4G_02080 [Thermodesulfobacteriota bacterium]
MKIALYQDGSLAAAGADLLLRQLGVSFTYTDTPKDYDLLITPREIPIAGKALCLLVDCSEPGGYEIQGGVLSFNEIDAFFPGRISIDPAVDGKILGVIDEEKPGITHKGRMIRIFPPFCEYIARASCLHVYDKHFAESFGFDRFRYIFLKLLEYCSSVLSKPFTRVWFYPTYEYRNAIAFTTDVDHLLQWEIISKLDKWTHLKKYLYRATKNLESLPANKLRLLAAVLSSVRMFHQERFQYLNTRFDKLVFKTVKKAGISIPAHWHPSPFPDLICSGFPITAFVRGSDFQKEENLDFFLNGTGRLPYKSTFLENIELGLHFGATIGWGRLPSTNVKVFINNQYESDPFGDSINDQKSCLEDDIGREVSGARIHHQVQGFSPAVFRFINRFGFEYDSSVFGGSSTIDTNWSPNGCTLPYYPILIDGDKIERAEFVELPISCYEAKKFPTDEFHRNHSSVVVSSHPDSATSDYMSLIRNVDDSWWKVTLGELALWWKERTGIVSEINGTNVVVEKTPSRFCVVVYPKNDYKLVGARIKSKYISDHYMIYDCTN